ncbi:MAG: D-cysteine desulfhydrase family protein [Solirubrobacterales bacterium]
MYDYFRKIPKVDILNLPTPLCELKRLSKYLGGPDIFLKRDDLTGLGLGGNKTRKLEFLIGEALAKGCDSIIMHGDIQSNCCRQAAAAAAAVGIKCHLALSGVKPDFPEGNLLLDYIFGAEIHWCGKYTKGEKVPEIAEDLKNKGLKPYIIPYGGSNVTGVLGFASAINEISSQLNNVKIDYIITPSSSGGTHAGIVLGADMFGLNSKVIGIGIDRNAKGEYEYELSELANGAASKIGFDKRYKPEDFIMNYDYFGEGYGVIGEIEKDAMYLTGKYEGILMDPVYNGRAMGALIDMIRKDKFKRNEKVLIWHTGGIQAVFTRSNEICGKIE